MTHVPEVWSQLRRLYQPVVAALLGRPVSVCEVVRSFDPVVDLPEAPTLITDIEPWTREWRPEFGVFQWKR